MTITVSRLYDTNAQARTVVSDLQDSGIPSGDISIVANNGDDAATMSNTAEDASAGLGLGAVAGGGAGLLAGLGVMAIPGLGPIVAAGWLAATLTGAVAGAATGAIVGGVVGTLTEGGVSEKDAHVYAESIRRGGSMVIVKTDDSNRDLAEMVFNRHPTVAVADRRATYQQEGWQGFDDKRGPYMPTSNKDGRSDRPDLR